MRAPGGDMAGVGAAPLSFARRERRGYPIRAPERTPATKAGANRAGQGARPGVPARAAREGTRTTGGGAGAGGCVLSRTAYEARRRERQAAGLTELKLSQPVELRHAYRVVNADVAVAAAAAAAERAAIEAARLEPEPRRVVTRDRPAWLARRGGLAGGAKAKRAARDLAAEIALLVIRAGADPAAAVEAVGRGLALARTAKS